MRDVATLLTFLGALCEAGGIGLRVREFVRVEDREFPEKRNRLVRMWRRVQLRLGRKPPAQVIEGFGRGTVRVDCARVEDPDDVRARIERLERVVDDRDREHRATLERVEACVGDIEAAHARSLEGLRSDLEHARADQREALRESLTLQKAYAGLFAIGVAFSAAGSVMG